MFRFNFVILAAGKNPAMNIGTDTMIRFKISSIILYVQNLYKTLHRFFGRFNGIIDYKSIIVDNYILVSFGKQWETIFFPKQAGGTWKDFQDC